MTHKPGHDPTPVAEAIVPALAEGLQLRAFSVVEQATALATNIAEVGAHPDPIPDPNPNPNSNANPNPDHFTLIVTLTLTLTLTGNLCWKKHLNLTLTLMLTVSQTMTLAVDDTHWTPIAVDAISRTMTRAYELCSRGYGYAVISQPMTLAVLLLLTNRNIITMQRSRHRRHHHAAFSCYW